MTTYNFEDASASDAAAFAAGDFLHFKTGLPSNLAASYEEAGPLAVPTISLTYGGKTLTFAADSLQQGDAIDFREDGISRGSIMLLGPQSDTISLFSVTNKAAWSFGGADHITMAGRGILHVHAGDGDDLVEADNVRLPDGSWAQTGYYFVDLGNGNDQLALHLATGPADAMGGLGDDTIEGGQHNDHLYGNAPGAMAGSPDGNDSIDGGSGNDYIHGNAGDDILLGGLGNDRIYGGAGEDLLSGGEGQDYLQGNKGPDTLSGGIGNDTLRGGADDDRLLGMNGDDRLFGDAGDDNLSGGPGVDTLNGGAGADVFRFMLSDAVFAPANSSGQVDRVEDFTKGVDHIGLGFAVATVLVDPAPTPFTTMGAAAAHASELMAGYFGDREVVAMTVGNDTLLFYARDGGQTADSAIRLDGFDYRSVDLSCFL
jgi:serralysin